MLMCAIATFDVMENCVETRYFNKINSIAIAYSYIATVTGCIEFNNTCKV